MARPATAVPSPAEYVARASSLDLFVIRASDVALQRSTSARVRDFATSAISLHQGTSAQLSFAGRRLNVPPSATLAPAENQSLTELEQSAAFDRTYAAQQKAVHRQALELHSNYAVRGTSPTLRPVAEFIAARLREQQAAVTAL